MWTEHRQMTTSAGLASMALLLVAAPAPVSADRGSIIMSPGVKLYEPNQRAIIAWDGKQEILLLSTDLRASRPTKILQVLPLPSKPQVKKGSVKSFVVATRIINRYRLRRARRRNGHGARGRHPRPRARYTPAGRVVLAKKIGSHHVSVTEVLDGARFVTWVQRYLKAKGYGKVKVPAAMRKVVGEYIRDGFKWFVFDIVSVGRKAVTLDAIEYTFKSKRLYYPLRITRSETGWTKVKLLVLTPHLFSRRSFVGYPYRKVRVPHKPVPLSGAQLRRISPAMYKLMKSHGSYRLRMWQLSGFLNRFRRDLLCTAGRTRVRAKRKRD